MNISSILRNVAKFFIYLAVVSPLVLASSLFFPFINGKVLLFRISVELAFLFYILYLLQTKKLPNFKLLKNPIAIAVAVFCLVFLITSLTGISPHSSFWSNFERGEGAFQLLHYVFFFFLALSLFNTKVEWRRLLIFAVFISFLVSMYGLGQWIELQIRQPGETFKYVINTGGRTSGTLGNPSYLTGYLLFHFVFIVWLIFAAGVRKYFKWFLGFLLIFELGIFLTAKTLAAILGLTTGVLIIISLYALKIYKTSRAAYLGSFLIVIILGSLIYSFSQIDLYKRLQPRLWTWGSAVTGIVENPILGWGAESFPQPFDQYHNPNHYGGETWFDRTHNIFLEYLISGGIILLLAFLAIFFFYYKGLFQMERGWLWPAFLVVPLAYLIQGLTLFDVLPIYVALFLFLAFFIHYSESFSFDNQLKENDYDFNWSFIYYSMPFAAFVLFLLYFGNYLPLRKNQLLANALRAKNISEAIDRSKTVFAFYSPIGQQEAYESMGRNFVIFLEGVIREKTKIDPKNTAFLEIMKLNDTIYEEIKPGLVGVKDSYLNALWNWAAFRASGDPSYLNKSKTALDELLQIAPRRMEIILARFDIAQMENDNAKKEELLNLIDKIRPDALEKLGYQKISR
ncbi:MAG: O-antigen ligase family protein [Patescibacteria group bacterium]